MEFGYTCSSEEFEASELVEFAVLAEDVGFDFVTVSDHFHPWTSTQGHSPFAWTTIGAIGVSTDRVRIGSGVTCPLIRVHPAIVAQAAATSWEVSRGRFFLGLGTGELLNEHVVSTRWPAIDVRQEMLAEAIEVMRALWTGETVAHHGTHYTVENARLFSAPQGEVPIIWAASGEESATLAAAHAYGLWATRPDAQLVEAYRSAGGDGDVIGQLTLCWAQDESTARATAHEHWSNSSLPGDLAQDLPTWTHFEEAISLVTEDMVAERVVCGPDLEPLMRAVCAFIDAGFTSVHFHQVGPDQFGFLDWWKNEARQALAELAA